jgi:small GTP-binding protein
MSKKNEEEEIKVILIGDTQVGKTSLINVTVGTGFNPDEQVTISASCSSKKLMINDKKYNINFWDTAGREEYRGIAQLFYRGAEIVILVYDICSLSSFNSLENWYEICEDTIGNEHIYGIVGNKNDLYLESKTNEDDAKKFAESKKAKFKLVSAKEDPRGFVDFIEDLVIDYKKITQVFRRQSIKIDREKNFNKNNKENCFKCQNNS